MPVLTQAECRRVAEYLRRDDVPPPVAWEKGRAVQERVLYELATRPAVLEPVVDILGEDVVLWGLSAVRKGAGETHPWHSDIESCAPGGGFVSVWIGIENTSHQSSLQLIPGSHLFGEPFQEARVRHDVPREAGTAEAALRLAREREPGAEVTVPDMGDGEAIFFDGRLWHGTENRRREGERVALVCQFAGADRRIRIPDWDALDWPFRFLAEPEPPVVLVRGSGRGSSNRLVAPPPCIPAEGSRIETVVHPFALPVDAGRIEPWQPFQAFHGPTRTCADLSCHASVLAGGESPHPPHAHDEEELLVPLHGEVELVIAAALEDPAPRVERLRPGAFVYYPASQQHTIRNPGGAPAAYLMLKWRGAAVSGRSAIDTEIVHFGDVSRPEHAGAFWSHELLDGPTRWLERLHSHLTVLQPGAGYAPHRDAHDVAIVTLDGIVETLGRTVPPGSVVFCAAGELHGMRNVGAEPARYLVFELHAPPATRARSFLRASGGRAKPARAPRP